MTPEQEMDVFKDEMKNHGKASQHALWNMTGTIFGTLLTGLSIIAAIKPNCNKVILSGSILVSVMGMFFIWRCFNSQTKFYAKVMGISQSSINTQGKDYVNPDLYKEPLKLIAIQVCSEKLANYCLVATILGLILTICV
jgi:hypothetical protein